MSEILFREGYTASLAIPQEKHQDLLVRGFNSIDVTTYLLRTFPMHPGEELEWIRNLPKRANTDQVFIVLAHRGDERIPIGTMGLHHIDWVHRTATTGAAIVDKAFWGGGYGSEAKMLLLKYAFDDLGLRKIKSSVLAHNSRSQKYNERCGYFVEGVLKEDKFKDGRYVDEVLMAVTRDTWLPIWTKYLHNKNGTIK